MIDARDLPLRFLFSPGQASNKSLIPALFTGFPPPRDTVANRGYDAQAILRLIAEHGSRAHIPIQRDRLHQRSVASALYRQRNLVERFFNKLKHFHAIVTRYHKLARNFLAAIRLWIRQYEPTT